MKLRIREWKGTYFKGMTGVGPCFGATWKEAATFSDGMEAYRLMGNFPAVVLCDLVNERRQACDVRGKPLSGRGKP